MELVSVRAAVPAAGPGVPGVAGVVVRSRCHLPARPFDPHTDRDLRRKLTDRERSILDDLADRLRFIDRRLETIAARHHEVL